MEAQLQRPTHENTVMEGEVEGEHNHKKSVLKKVKDKAKKIKGTIKKHGGHGHDDHDNCHDQISEGEHDEMNEDTVTAPEVLGAPMYESAFISGTKLPIQTGVNPEKPTGHLNVRNEVYPDAGDSRGVTKTPSSPEDQYNPNVRNEVFPHVGDGSGVTKTLGLSEDTCDPNARNEVYPNVGNGRGMTKASGLLEDRRNPNVKNEVYVDVGDGGMTKTSSLPEARYNPNVRNEVYADVGDGGMTKTSSLPEARYNPNVRNEVYADVGDGGMIKNWGLLADQHIYNVTNAGYPDIGDSVVTRSSGVLEGQHNTDVYPDIGDGGVSRSSGMGKMGSELGRSTVEAPRPELKTHVPTGPTAIDLEEASLAEPMVKIGPLVDLEEDPHSPKNYPEKIPPSSYQAKVIDPTGEGGEEAQVAPLVRRLDNLHVHDESEPDPGSEPRSYTGSHDQFAPQPTPTDDQFNPKSNPVGSSKDPESPKSFDPEKPESMPRDTIAGKISSATSVIADKAVSAKSVVASKLGYNSKHQEGQDSSRKPISESATEYGYKVAEKLAPVYEKVAGAGSAVMSKVQRGGGAEHEDGDTSQKVYDKGVSVKEYLAEKFSPSDEDEALSGVITDAIYKKKEGIYRTGEEQPIGRVNESENVVTPHSGVENESKRNAVDAGHEKSGAAVVDRLKGAVSSWLGKTSGTQTAQHSLGQEYGSGATGERGLSKEQVRSQQPRLEESGN